MTRRPPADYVCIGRLGRSFKLSGGVRLRLDNADQFVAPDSPLDDNDAQHSKDLVLASLGRLFVPGLGETRLRGHEFVSGSTVVYLEGVRDRTVARSLVNAEVWAARADVPAELVEELTAPSPAETLIGAAVTVDGVRVGTVSAAHLGGSNDYVEALLDSGVTVLLPLTAPYVTVNEAGVALVDAPPGLLDG